MGLISQGLIWITLFWMYAVAQDPNHPILHGCSFAWQARLGPRVWPRQEEGGHELEGKVDVYIIGIPDHGPTYQSEH